MNRTLVSIALLCGGCDSFQSMAVSQFSGTYHCPSEQAAAQLADGGGIVVTGCGRQVKYSCSESTTDHTGGRRSSTSSTSECHEVDGGE